MNQVISRFRTVNSSVLVPAWLAPLAGVWITLAAAVTVLLRAVTIPAQLILLAYAGLALAHGALRRRWTFAAPIAVLSAAGALLLAVLDFPLHTSLKRAGEAGDSNGAGAAWVVVLVVAAVLIGGAALWRAHRLARR